MNRAISDKISFELGEDLKTNEDPTCHKIKLLTEVAAAGGRAEAKLRWERHQVITKHDSQGDT